MPFRLLHVTTVPETFTFFRGQIAFMRERGVEVHAVSSPGPALGDVAEREGIEVHAVEMPRRISPGRDLVSVTRLVRLFRRLRPDVVHSHTPKGGLLGMVAATLAGVPVRFYHMRGLPMTTASGVQRPLLRAAERTSCALADRVFCVSSSLRDVALREGLCPPDRIRVLAGGSSNGVDAAGRFDPARLPAGTRGEVRRELGIPSDAAVVGFVGRVVRDKGIVELAGAWRALRDEFPRLRLLLVGPEEAQDPVPADVGEALRSDPRVHRAGARDDVPRLYSAMDVLAFPTYREGFPNVPLEAASLGLPVVATRIPGCIDAVEDGVTGTLVPVRDAGALADAVRAYLLDPSVRECHGAAGRARVLRDFQGERIWAELHREYVRRVRAVRAGGAGEERP